MSTHNTNFHAELKKSILSIERNDLTYQIKSDPVAEWLRTLIFSILNRLSSHHCGFEPSLGHIRDKPSSACGWSGGFSWGSPVFAPLND